MRRQGGPWPQVGFQNSPLLLYFFFFLSWVQFYVIAPLFSFLFLNTSLICFLISLFFLVINNSLVLGIFEHLKPYIHKNI
jgi:hypothetical protein